MNRKILFGTLILSTFLLTSSCDDDDKVASVPSYAEMEVTDDIYTGQKGKATVFLKDVGAYVLHSDNSYTLSKGGKVWEKGSWRVVDPKDNNPEFVFTVPSEPGLYSLAFSSKFSFYVDLPNGGVYGQSNSVSATVDVKMADAVDACWGDSRDRLASVLTVNDTVVNSAPCKVWRGKMAFYEVEKIDLDSLGGDAERVYEFDAEGGLSKVTEKTTFALSYKSSYKEFDDGTSKYVNDSIDNKYIYTHLNGVRDIPYYVLEDNPVLEGVMAAKYPVANWGKYTSDVERANLVNAFWCGDITNYSQMWCLYDEWTGEAVTKCRVSAYCEDNKFVIERVFVKFD